MTDYRKKQQRNGIAMFASGLAMLTMSYIGDVPGPWDEAGLLATYLASAGTVGNSIRLHILEYREKKMMKGR